MTGAPIAMLAELTHRCPLSCPYCSNPLELTRKEAELVTKEWFKQYRGASGIDVQIHATQAELEQALGADKAHALAERSVGCYSKAADHAAACGIIIADTKFEFGEDEQGRLVLADEVLTPDSSRFWPRESYAVGSNPPSLDKQFVRDWLDSVAFNHQPPAPVLPDEVVAKTRAKYVEAYETLTGQRFV